MRVLSIHKFACMIIIYIKADLKATLNQYARLLIMNTFRPEHQKPQFFRPDWQNLNGVWTCHFDFGNSGIERGLAESAGFEQEINVPFCPESSLSGIGHTDFIEKMWYHRKITVPVAWDGKKILLHFGAVDYECEIFIDGRKAGFHYGGSSSFCLDVSSFVLCGKEHDLVVRVSDKLRSGVQTGGKQSRTFKSQGCSYTRVTGIWQTVWLEAVAAHGLRKCRIVPDLDNRAFIFTPDFFAVERGQKFTVRLFDGDRETARKTTTATTGTSLVLTLDEPKTWSPAEPFLYKVIYEVSAPNGEIVDQVESYAGLRKIHIEGDKIFLNNEPLFLRMVLDQGYYPDGIWTASSDAALKRDIELSMRAGFNGARLHQKVFEERFHYWADKLGYLTWGESASWGMRLWSESGPSQNVAASARNFLSEWREIIERDANHPSIIAWTPFNETCDPLDLREHYRLTSEAYDLTRQLDPTRPVNDASGYCHVKTDLWTLHLYRPDAAELAKALMPEDGSPVLYHQSGIETEYAGQPIINDEFGGFRYIPGGQREFADNSWGYYGSVEITADALYKNLMGQVDVMLQMENCSGYCYTQLTDVEQEQNGIYNYDRTDKFDMKKIAEIFGKKR